MRILYATVLLLGAGLSMIYSIYSGEWRWLIATMVCGYLVIKS